MKKLVDKVRVNQTYTVMVEPDDIGYVKVVGYDTEFYIDDECEGRPVGTFLRERIKGDYFNELAVYEVKKFEEKSETKAIAELKRIV